MSALGRISLLVPDAIMARLLPRGRRFDPRTVPAPIAFRSGARHRVLIGPENSAGQAEGWARALVAGTVSTDAVAFQVERGSRFQHAVTARVPAPVFAWSRRWQAAHRRAVLARATHVLIESGRPVLAGGARGDVDRDVRDLLARGIRVAFLWHGSDIRDPDRHAAERASSPYADESWAAVPALRVSSAAQRRRARSSPVPSFVSTPDLLDDLPAATWLPLVVDPDRWAGEITPTAGRPLRVVHAPSTAVVKGTSLIEPVLTALAAEGVIEYRRIEGVPHDEMPAVLRGADVVLEQFRLGSYGVAAVEAMAAGRIVIADIDDRVRERVREQSGRELPIISASAADLEGVLRAIVADPAAARDRAAQGPAFVRAVHDGRLAAAVLSSSLGLDGS
ncbi:hypothetical protein [Yonghaparkia sp. Soil809]|uniref:hypothetical protein n=1 Tax=Yonghaparkia sp. Soil809 TaxID=1736417 RepID=UPI000A5CFCF7|nr:hypothetical protein [Yonghaparkia sp. Soil809]